MIQQPTAATRGRAEIQGLQVLESCGFTWIFDEATLRFRRVPRHAGVGLDVPAGWTPYHRLEIDGARNSFVVALNEAGTRILRAWLHIEPCERCLCGDRLGTEGV